MLKKINLALAGLLLAAGCFAQVSVKVTDGTSTELILGSAGKKYTSYLQAITTGGVTVTTTATYVQLLFCTNTSGSARTLTIADTQGSPVTFWSTVSVAANSVVLLQASAVGLYMQGITITASANSAISCQVQGVQ